MQTEGKLEITAVFFLDGLNRVEGLPEGTTYEGYRLNSQFTSPDTKRAQFERYEPTPDAPLILLYDGSQQPGKRIVAHKVLPGMEITLREADAAPNDPAVDALQRG